MPALTILHHPDPRRVGESARLDALPLGRPVLLSRLEPDFAHPGAGEGRPLRPLRPLDTRHISRSPLRCEPAGEAGAVRITIGESRTPVAADGLPVVGARAFSAREVERGVVLELSDRVVLLLHTVPDQPFGNPEIAESFGLVGESEGLLRIRNEIRRVADLDVPVLLRGETGTGKELVARAIHQASPRHGGPWLSVNVGAIPASIATSELFGAVKGAFTGSVRDQAGYFQRAHGGTLFLDEIGEAPPEVQVMLLRVLETGEIQRVGGQEPQRVDVRLIAATDADLERSIEEGRFRAPLLHRLAGYEILVPALRERRDDFGRLFVHFLREELHGVGEEHRLAPPADEDARTWLPASVVARLARHGWPGNVRQLRNAARQIVISSRTSDTAQIGPQIERLLREAAPPAPPPPEAAAALEPKAPEPPARKRARPRDYRLPSEVTESEVIEALRDHQWEVKPAAEQLGIARPSLYVLIDKFPSIRKAADLSRAEILECRALCNGDLNAMAARLEVSKKGLQQRMTQLGV